MKKGAIALLMAGMIAGPLVTMADGIPLGWNGAANGCTIWRQGDPESLTQGGYCTLSSEADARLYVLEEAVNALTVQNQQLQSEIAHQSILPAGATPTAPTDDVALGQRVTALESRMSAAEKDIAFIKTTVLSVIGQVVTLLQKLSH